MMATPTLTSAEQEFHLLLPHPPKALAGTSAPFPGPAPNVPTTPPARAGQVRATFLTAWEAVPVQKPA